jgi:integrative and conjugative element protein (TIGR02256 family)
MNQWCARTLDEQYNLVVEPRALHQLNQMCVKASGVETGGVLIGYYSVDLSTAIVVEASGPPADSQQKPSWFSRGVKGLEQMLKKRWHSENRTYYLGEWHFHPVGTVQPSTVDIEQMYLIRENGNYRCKDPLLLILGVHSDAVHRHARAFVFPSGATYKELFSFE